MEYQIHYRHNKPQKMNYCNFGSYKDNTGKMHKYTDVNGVENENGFSTKRPVILLDVSQEHFKLLDDFLQNHPLVTSGMWERHDLAKEEESEASKIMVSANAVLEAAKMSNEDVAKFAKLAGISSLGSAEALKAKVLKMANDNPHKFLEIHDDADKEHRLTLRELMAKGTVTYVNDVYKYGAETMGLNEEQAINWLTSNRDVYALLKKSLNKTKKTAKKETVK